MYTSLNDFFLISKGIEALFCFSLFQKSSSKAFEFPNKLFYSILDTESNLKHPVQKTMSGVMTLVLFFPLKRNLQFSILKHT